MTYDDEDDPLEWLLENENALLMITRMDREGGNIKSELNKKANLTGKPTSQILEAAQDIRWIEEASLAQDDPARADKYELTRKGEIVQDVLQDTDIEEIYEEYVAQKQDFERDMDRIKEYLEEMMSEIWGNQANHPIREDARRDAEKDEPPLSKSEIQDRRLYGTGAFEPDSVMDEREPSSSDDEDG